MGKFDTVLGGNQLLAKISSMGFVITASRTIVNLVISKVIALTIGASGIALYSQLANVSALLTSISTGAGNTGIVKYTAERKGDNVFYRELMSTVLKFNLMAGAAIALCLCLFSNFFASKFFFSESYAGFTSILGICILFSGLNIILLAVLNGLGKYRLFFIYSLVVNFSLVSMVLLSLQFATTQSILYAYVVTQVLAFALMAYVVIKERLLRLDFYTNSVFSFDIIKLLSKYTIMSLSAVVFINVSQIIIRSYIIDVESESVAGLWDATLRISASYFAVIISSLGIYYLPVVSALETRTQIKGEIRKVFVFMAPIIIVGFIAIFFLRDLAIRIVFSKEFLLIGDFFDRILLADFFKWIGWLFSYVLIAKGSTKWYVANEFMAFLAITGFSVIGLKYDSLNGLFNGHLGAYLFYMLTSVGIVTIFLKKLKP